ncbi:MAG: hypothetical protein OIN66_04370 [Candidatus Methanoperedens sp.]|nr:hypothetical protein [Candidatus Methanoperedens sp.]
MNEHHLIRQFPKPREGEYVPITFIEFKRKTVGWSPRLKRSVYIEKEEEKTDLKRIREVNVLVMINHLSGKVASIELTDEEKRQFEEIYKIFLEKGGQLVYTRKKVGAKNIPCFEVQASGRRTAVAPEKILLSDKM